MLNRKILEEIFKVKLAEDFTGKINFNSQEITEGDVFIALPGEQKHGMDYAISACENGAAYVITPKLIVGLAAEKQIVISDPLAALIKIAEYKREVFKGKIIAITGSMGKTTVKDFSNFIFAKKFKTYASFGNFNNHIGMPLCLANLDLEAEFAFFELGMNHSNEISYLSKILRPDIAIITCIANAHIGNFNHISEIAAAKLEIADGLNEKGVLLVNNADKNFQILQQELTKLSLNKEQIHYLGAKNNFAFELMSVRKTADFLIEVVFKIVGEEYSFKINDFRLSAAINYIFPFYLLFLFKKQFTDILPEIADYTATLGRGSFAQLKFREKNIFLIDETYNSNPDAVKALLRDLSEFHDKYEICLLLGDMLELGEEAKEFHLSLAKYVEQAQINKLITIGAMMKRLHDKLHGKVRILAHYDSSSDFLVDIADYIANKDLVVIKGSRGIKMDAIVKKLKEENNAA